MILLPAAVNIMAATPAKGASKVDLSGAWTGFWNTVTSSWTGLANMLTIIGLILVVFALVKWAWDRRRGGGMQGSGALWGSLIPGAILLAPKVIIPLLLWFIDAIANLVVDIIESVQ